jgi:MFS family permease
MAGKATVRASGITMRAGAGVLGGWLAIMPATVITLTLRVDSLGASASTYASILAAGWLVMLIALIGTGRWSDSVMRRTGGRSNLIRIGAPLMAASGLLLALAPSPGWLAAAWVLAQVPAAMVITTALATSGDSLPPDRRGLASGVIGAAPIIALFVGSVFVRFLADALIWAFILPALLGALLALPLMRDYPPTEGGGSRDASTDSVRGRVLIGAWIGFLLASFLLSWATSTTNGFIVLFIESVSDVVPDDVATSAANAVILASLVAVIASVLAGALSHGQQRAVAMWAVSALICGVALAMLLASPTSLMVLIAAALFGIAFGIANGVELAIVLLLRTAPQHFGRDLGLFTAVTTAPYVLVPTLASVIVRSDVDSGLVTLFGFAAVVAGLGAVVVALIYLRTRRLNARLPRTLDPLPR